MKSDLIYRQDAIDEFKSYGKRVDTATQLWTIMGCAEIIRNLPSAQPERMRGDGGRYTLYRCWTERGANALNAVLMAYRIGISAPTVEQI